MTKDPRSRIGFRIIISSIYSFCESLYRINLMVACGIYYGLFTDFDRFEVLYNYFDGNYDLQYAYKEFKVLYASGNVTTEVVLFGGAGMAIIFCCIISFTCIMTFIISFPLLTCGICFKQLGQATCKYVLIPWLILSAISTGNNIYVVYIMYSLARSTSFYGGFLFSEYDLVSDIQPIDTDPDEYVHFIRLILSFLVSHYLCFDVWVMCASMAIMVKDVTVLWKYQHLPAMTFELDDRSDRVSLETDDHTSSILTFHVSPSLTNFRRSFLDFKSNRRTKIRISGSSRSSASHSSGTRSSLSRSTISSANKASTGTASDHTINI